MTTDYTCLASDVRAKLTYSLPNPNGTTHRPVILRPGTMFRRSNYIADTREVVIRDLRGQEQNFSLDKNGFEFLAHETTENFQDENSIKTNYYEETRKLVLDHTGAHRAYIITHRIRQGYDDDDLKNDGISREQQPAFIVHTDRTHESVADEVKKYLGEDAERLLQGRVRFINVWRPIGNVVHHEPLAVVDWQSSTDTTKLFPLTIERGHSVDDEFDIYLSRFSRAHSWYFLRHQDPSEVLMMKFSDNSPGVANICLHSSFRDPGCDTGAPRRRSIEVSMLVFG